jgi:hypothetical protein
MTEGEIGRQVDLVGKNKINGKVNLKKWRERRKEKDKTRWQTALIKRAAFVLIDTHSYFSKPERFLVWFWKHFKYVQLTFSCVIEKNWTFREFEFWLRLIHFWKHQVNWHLREKVTTTTIRTSKSNSRCSDTLPKTMKIRMSKSKKKIKNVSKHPNNKSLH